jgi:molybdate transport system substrate-binding protein
MPCGVPVAAAGSVSYSTGPSGVYLAKLFDVGVSADSLKDKIVQAPTGRSRRQRSSRARGDVELGFPAVERAHASWQGIDVVGACRRP